MRGFIKKTIGIGLLLAAVYSFNETYSYVSTNGNANIAEKAELEKLTPDFERASLLAKRKHVLNNLDAEAQKEYDGLVGHSPELETRLNNHVIHINSSDWGAPGRFFTGMAFVYGLIGLMYDRSRSKKPSQ